MTTSSVPSDYFSANRPPIRSRIVSAGVLGTTTSPSSPRTPLLGRSISSQFGSPGSFRVEQEDSIIYELGSRHLSAGFSGESRPRCVLSFNPESDRRLGDYRAVDPNYRLKRRKLANEDEWGKDYELYRADLRALDLGLVEDRLERALRTIHTDHLQLDQKPRKAMLIVPSLLPTPLLEIAVKVLLNYSSPTPLITILTTPLLTCVGAGVRDALVVDVGWEESVVTAVGEHKEVCQRRSIRAGRLLTLEMAKLLEEEVINQRGAGISTESSKEAEIEFEYAEEVTRRLCWCRARSSSASNTEPSGMIGLPPPDSGSDPRKQIHMPFQRLSRPAETVLFANTEKEEHDDNDYPLHLLAYHVLLALPLDLRAICVSRIIITGASSDIPGLKARLLQEISHLMESRGWDRVDSYGSARAPQNGILRERSGNFTARNLPDSHSGELDILLSPTKKPIQESIPHSQRIHDDKYDNITQKAEREANKGKTAAVKGVVRGVETLGAWAGASLMASLKVKGVYELEREEFLKSGLQDTGRVM